MKKQKYKKVVEWENEEIIIMVIFLLFATLLGAFTKWYLILTISIPVIALTFIYSNVKRKVYWVKMK